MKNKYIGYIGTYTNEESEGIYSFVLDSEKGQLSDVKLAAKLGNPTYLAISDDQRFLYSVIKEGASGGVAAFKMNAETGELDILNTTISEGAPPCHVSVNRDHSNLFSANYHKGTVESYLIDASNGSVNPATSVIEHFGSGPDERQEKAHTHYAGITPDEKYAIAIDLGIDKVITYEVEHGVLTEKSSLSVKPGSGPRHLVFHPNGKYAYIMTEFSSEIIVTQYDSVNGELTPIQTVSTLPANFIENNQGSAIHISSDGRFVYAGNRGHDSIAIFSAHPEMGELQFVEHTSTEGHWPRDFVLDPTEKFIVASNQKSNNLVLFSRNEISGKLTLLQSNIYVSEPVCIKFVSKLR